MRWSKPTPHRPQTLYDRVLELGTVIQTARGLEFADEWPNHICDWLLQRDQNVNPGDVGYAEVLEALHALEYIGEKT